MLWSKLLFYDPREPLDNRKRVPMFVLIELCTRGQYHEQHVTMAMYIVYVHCEMFFVRVLVLNLGLLDALIIDEFIYIDC